MNGTAFSSYAVVPRKALEILGEENLGQYSVTERAAKHYCMSCGTPIFNVNSKYAGACMLYLGTIKGSEAYAPELNVYCESMLSWLESVVALKGYAEGPEG
jgi:hypothetical protein